MAWAPPAAALLSGVERRCADFTALGCFYLQVFFEA